MEKSIGVKPPEKPEEAEENFEIKLKTWDEWDDDNHAARAIMINTMSKGQVLRYCNEKFADRPWNMIKCDMAAGTEQVRVKALGELTNLKMAREESADEYINRAEGLRNQCVQLGKEIEDYELKMYVLRGLRIDFDQNVRILENQRDVTLNDIRYALKQEEGRRKNKKEDKTERESESVRKANEKKKNDIFCYNCGKRGHVSSECYGKQKCFNCQKFGHISTDCEEPKNHKSSRGRGQRGRFHRGGRWTGSGRGQGRSESTRNVTDETVLRASDQVCESEREKTGYEESIWLLDSGSTSHMSYDEKMFNELQNEEREITLADKEGRTIKSNGIGEVLMKQDEIKERIRLNVTVVTKEKRTSERELLQSRSTRRERERDIDRSKRPRIHLSLFFWYE